MSGPKLLRSKLLRSLIIPLALLVLAGGVYLYLRYRQGRRGSRWRMTAGSL